MFGEHDEHLLPYDPTLGTEREGKSRVARRHCPSAPRLPWRAKEAVLFQGMWKRGCWTSPTGKDSWVQGPTDLTPLTSASLI